MRPIQLVVILFLVLLLFEWQDNTDAQLIFYIPFRLLTGIFRPLRLLITFGVLRRRIRFTRRFLQLMATPMVHLRSEKNGVGGQAILRLSPRRLDLQEQRFFKSLSANDPQGCLLRLVCELHATRHEHKLGSMEYDILEAFRYYEEDSTPNKLFSKLPIFAAADVGKKSNSVKQCESSYRSCPYSSHQIMMTFMNHEKTEQWPRKRTIKTASDQTMHHSSQSKPFTIKVNLDFPRMFSG